MQSFPENCFYELFIEPFTSLFINLLNSLLEIITVAILLKHDYQEVHTIRHPDIVTLDIKLPDINGSELLKEMKKKRPDMPVIILTGYDNHPDVSEADAYIVKTLSCGEELKKSIKNLLAPGHGSQFLPDK